MLDDPLSDDGLLFTVPAAPAPSHPSRADIALFVGFVARRNTPLPDDLNVRLASDGWAGVDDLLDVPVPIDSWNTFDTLFAWEERPLGTSGQMGTTYLGAAVRSFFAQGGRTCYVVRAGSPWPCPDLSAEQGAPDHIDRIAALIPGWPNNFDASPADRSSWHGIAHLFGLPDVSFLCLPDLADAVSAVAPPQPVPKTTPPTAPERFVPCSAGPAASSSKTPARRYLAPRCAPEGYTAWAQVVSLAGTMVRRYCPEVQLLAAIPLPHPGTPAERDLLSFLLTTDGTPLAAGLDGSGIASAFVQLCYPWVRSTESPNLPEGLESPEGVLAGILAANALWKGAFGSAAGSPLGDVYDLYPLLSRGQMRSRQQGPGLPHSLVERVSLFGFDPNGLSLLSDVTTSLDENYRPAPVSRLVAVLIRAARQLGEQLVFEPAGEQLWARIESHLGGLMFTLYQLGALRGASAGDAFSVQCNRGTMSQNDLDNGRVVARVQFDAAAPIDNVTISLALSGGGTLSVRGAA